MKLYRADRWSGTWSCPGRSRAQGPLQVVFDDGVAEITEAVAEDLAPWMARNQFALVDNRPKRRKPAAKKTSSAKKASSKAGG